MLHRLDLNCRVFGLLGDRIQRSINRVEQMPVQWLLLEACFQHLLPVIVAGRLVQVVLCSIDFALVLLQTVVENVQCVLDSPLEVDHQGDWKREWLCGLSTALAGHNEAATGASRGVTLGLAVITEWQWPSAANGTGIMGGALGHALWLAWEGCR